MKRIKLSRYLIEVPLLEGNIPKVLVFGTRSGVLRYFNQSIWNLLKEKRWELISQETLRVLKEELFLVKDDEDEFKEVLKENNAYIDNSNVLYKVLQPSAYCPLGCDYCGQVHHPKSMRPEIQDAILLRTRQELFSRSYRALRIGWFGGEPLSGIKVIEALTPKFQELCREKGIHYESSIVTNGLFLTEAVAKKLIDEWDVRSIEITLDGIAEFHDQRRHTKTFGKTFDKIYSNLFNLVKHKKPNVEISIRCNVDERNHEGADLLIEKLAQDGLHHHVYFYIAPIHSWGNDAHQLSLAKQQFADREIEWLIKMRQLGFKNQANYLPSRKKMVCMAVDPSSSLIDTFGSIFHCTEVSLVPAYEAKGGKNIYETEHILSNKESRPQVELRDFYKGSILEYGCPSCVMLPTCGGGCPKEWKEGRIPCPSPKYNIEKRMLMEYVQHSNPSAFEEAASLTRSPPSLQNA